MWYDRFGQYDIKVSFWGWGPQNRDPRRKSPPEVFRLWLVEVVN